MGGKSKNSQRTKNNVKPSSSSRSAELLGAAASSFVGFSAHSDLGVVAVAPGFGATELAETFDPSITPEYQMVFRKMNKKDPMTKIKALQEFIDLLNSTRVDRIRDILPLWPNYYYNLANDVEHNVRELAQTAMRNLVQKCKRTIAPYLKQLIPVWLTSFYDTYAPAGSIAEEAFQQTFANKNDRTTEVCLHCQFEIIEYVRKNLIFHSASTLSQGKNLTPEESQIKYTRLVQCSLKGLSFFIRYTRQANLAQALPALRQLVKHQKFWSYPKSKISSIKASWFELIGEIMQSDSVRCLAIEHKQQLIAGTFADINESDPIAAPHVWAVILQIQHLFDDWFIICKFSRTILPKMLAFFTNNFDHNTEAVAPSILPFFSKITPLSVKEVGYDDFCLVFFGSLKKSILRPENTTGKAETSNLLKAYFECLRFFYKNLCEKSEKTAADYDICIRLLNENLFLIIDAILSRENNISKSFFQEITSLIVFWSQQLDNENTAEFYTTYLNLFWNHIHYSTTNFFEEIGMSDITYPDRLVTLLKILKEANPNPHVQKVKFTLDKRNADKRVKETKAPANVIDYIQTRLRPILIDLTRYGLAHLHLKACHIYVSCVFQMTTSIVDGVEFYKSLTAANTLDGTVKYLLSLRDKVEQNMWDSFVDVVFKVVDYFDKPDVYAYIETNLLTIPNKYFMRLVLKRLFQHPYSEAPEIRTIFAKPNMHDVLIEVGSDAIQKISYDDFNILIKMFYITGSGDFLITLETADALLKIVCEPFIELDEGARPNLCIIFLTHTFPLIVQNQYASPDVIESIIFTIFKYSVDNAHIKFFGTDKLYELTDLWNEILFDNDVVDDVLIKRCSKMLIERATHPDMDFTDIECIGNLAARFIVCCTGHPKVKRDWLNTTLLTMTELLDTDENGMARMKHFNEHCLFFEALHGQVAIADGISENCAHFEDIEHFLRVSAFKLITLIRLFSIRCERIPYIIECIESEDMNDEIFYPIQRQCANLMLRELVHNLHVISCFASLLMRKINFNSSEYQFAAKYARKIKEFIVHKPKVIEKVKKCLLDEALNQTDVSTYRTLMYLHFITDDLNVANMKPLVTVEELLEHFKNSPKAYIYTVQYYILNIKPKTIDINIRMESVWSQLVILRCCLHNHFDVICNEASDRTFIKQTTELISAIQTEHSNKKLSLMYNEEITEQSFEEVVNVVEYIKLLVEAIRRFPRELNIQIWDNIRIGLSSWVLSLSKSIRSFSNPKASLFIVAVFKMFHCMMQFIEEEKAKSSTVVLQDVIDEWEKLFSREVNLVCFKAFYELSIMCEDELGNYKRCYVGIMEYIAPCVEAIDYKYVYDYYKTATSLTLENITDILFGNLASPIQILRLISMRILKKLFIYYVHDDLKIMESIQDTLEDQKAMQTFHILNKYEQNISQYENPMLGYLDEFSFNSSDINDFIEIDERKAFTYMHMWECIISACSNAPLSLRSAYTTWLSEKKFDANFFHFLFRAMPSEVLKNFELRTISSDVLKEFNWDKIIELSNDVFSTKYSKSTRSATVLEKYACYLYAEVLRKLPATVRKWWCAGDARKKSFVDKLTTYLVSPVICYEELRAISQRKEKHENMTVKVHNSTREVFAVYVIDDARIELVIALAQNYPLGGVKVECGKQIGGRLLSRNVGMQLTLFLTHQNGTIIDGLTLWKNNLDKKFEGVEECYVCYTVIHQETLKLPKLSCKTCKKKFHSPCLYKWFTTSNKSTCPICRNIF